jgi:hypothetical protein
MKREFNVLVWNINSSSLEPYDVLPYFRNCWKEKYNKDNRTKISEAKTESKRKALLKEWVNGKSMCMFWSRCQWEFLVASWPFGSYRLKNDVKEFIPTFDAEDYSSMIKFENIITADMKKIDVHEQITMNIDIIVDILYYEFKLNTEK